MHTFYITYLLHITKEDYLSWRDSFRCICKVKVQQQLRSCSIRLCGIENIVQSLFANLLATMTSRTTNGTTQEAVSTQVRDQESSFNTSFDSPLSDKIVLGDWLNVSQQVLLHVDQ